MCPCVPPACQENDKQWEWGKGGFEDWGTAAQQQTVNAAVKSRMDDEIVFRETDDMNIWKGQLFEGEIYILQQKNTNSNKKLKYIHNKNRA